VIPFMNLWNSSIHEGSISKNGSESTASFDPVQYTSLRRQMRPKQHLNEILPDQSNVTSINRSLSDQDNKLMSSVSSCVMKSSESSHFNASLSLQPSFQPRGDSVYNAGIIWDRLRSKVDKDYDLVVNEFPEAVKLLEEAYSKYLNAMRRVDGRRFLGYEEELFEAFTETQIFDIELTLAKQALQEGSHIHSGYTRKVLEMEAVYRLISQYRVDLNPEFSRLREEWEVVHEKLGRLQDISDGDPTLEEAKYRLDLLIWKLKSAYQFFDPLPEHFHGFVALLKDYENHVPIPEAIRKSWEMIKEHETLNAKILSKFSPGSCQAAYWKTNYEIYLSVLINFMGHAYASPDDVIAEYTDLYLATESLLSLKNILNPY